MQLNQLLLVKFIYLNLNFYCTKVISRISGFPLYEFQLYKLFVFQQIYVKYEIMGFQLDNHFSDVK